MYLFAVCLETLIGAFSGNAILLNIIFVKLLWFFVHQKFWSHC